MLALCTNFIRDVNEVKMCLSFVSNAHTPLFGYRNCLSDKDHRRSSCGGNPL
jgi:hypothetical protein